MTIDEEVRCYRGTTCVALTIGGVTVLPSDVEDEFLYLIVAKMRAYRALASLREWQAPDGCQECGAPCDELLRDIHAVIARLAVVLAATGGFDGRE